VAEVPSCRRGLLGGKRCHVSGKSLPSIESEMKGEGIGGEGLFKINGFLSSGRRVGLTPGRERVKRWREGGIKQKRDNFWRRKAAPLMVAAERSLCR